MPPSPATLPGRDKALARPMLMDGGCPGAGRPLHQCLCCCCHTCTPLAACPRPRRLLPVCTSWEDVCWAHLRCWLDLSVDARLGLPADPEGALPGGEAALAELAGEQQVRARPQAQGGHCVPSCKGRLGVLWS